ncbi:sodium- and chloride-dependent GABA transporter 1-like isoform X2 [Agrilus planipennis]|uniref:Transporter n=1 Tax=Agrilus planipennis TaxID=224129 RepID=A0A7F5QX92_AGRPL|nr:sodium- and chloride-dependent GABA transporter 1-like isoform X2 [Agrilus planipennis]
MSENLCEYTTESENRMIEGQSGKASSPFCTITYVAPPKEDDDDDDDELDRGGWESRWDFLFSCISLSVGLGNVWRFPYLCYKNGGGAFLVTYGIAMVLCGIPLFFQEVAVGQYLGSGGLTFVGQLCPLLKGVGYATMTLVFLLDVYYCIIISWTLYYIMSTFVYMPNLPWRSCDNSWNTERCSNIDNLKNYNGTIMFNNLKNVSITMANASEMMSTAVEEFFERNVLSITNGISEFGGIQWKLLICLGLGWLLIYWVIRNGLHQSGKIIWFTALFPYVVLFVLLFRALTLEGAIDGLWYFVVPRWEELLTPQPWMEGATQIFFAYSIGCGALPVLGSYNKFHHNCYRDAVITCIVNTFTSIIAGCVTFAILGYLAFEKDTTVAEVVTSGPGLVFLTYPEVVLKLPWAAFWTLMFFFMLLLLGTDSAFCLVEAFITGVLDNWPKRLRPHKEKIRLFICLIMFTLGIPMISKGGMYIFQLMDYYSASGISLLWVCFFQTIAISWIFGTNKLCDCIEQMMGFRPNKFWTICWQFCAPVVMLNFKEGLEPNIIQRKLSIKDKQAGYLISDSNVAEETEP